MLLKDVVNTAKKTKNLWLDVSLKSLWPPHSFDSWEIKWPAQSWLVRFGTWISIPMSPDAWISDLPNHAKKNLSFLEH
jgi:hypothetical protein